MDDATAVSLLDKLKEHLTNPLLLGHFDANAPITLRTDACKYGIGAILAQADDGGTERVIADASRALSDPESRYSSTEQKGLTAIWAVKKFRLYAYGRRVTVVTDHHALCYFTTTKNLAGRLARWSLQLQDYDIRVVSKHGRKHFDVDCVSPYREGWGEVRADVKGYHGSPRSPAHHRSAGPRRSPQSACRT